MERAITASDALNVAPASDSFNVAVAGSLPKLRVYALSLTRNADRANDLVQQTIMRAMAGRSSFQAGTNFPAWIFRIQRNEFITQVRKDRRQFDLFEELVHTVSDKVAHRMSDPPRQEESLMMRDFVVAFRRLPPEIRVSLLLSQLHGLTYEQIARRTGVSTGTVKSRVCRGRAKLIAMFGPGLRPASARMPRSTGAYRAPDTGDRRLDLAESAASRSSCPIPIPAGAAMGLRAVTAGAVRDARSSGLN
jgi:RNA polymerase sigma-70 factor (ECF subfamily)